MGALLTLGHNVAATNKEEVPESAQEDVIRQHHDGPLHGHPGRDKTLEKIRRCYHFNGMKRKVTEFIRNCEECAKNKPSRHKPYGESQQMDLPEAAWDTITMDFVVKLPRSEDPVTKVKYDSILVVVDKLTKYAHLILWRETGTASELANVLLKELVSQRGLPTKIISDRDKLFTSKFWNTWTRQLGIDTRMSTAYHPQTDGQTERTNQTMEQYLRHYVNHRQDDWVELLPMAQFAYNNQQHSMTGMTPFFANYGRNPRWEVMAAGSGTSTNVEKLTAMHEEMKTAIESAQKTTSHRLNSKRLKGPTLERGDKVYLSTKNLRSKRPSKKLDHVRIGPFEIEKRTGEVNYRLRLPKKARIHRVFHVSLLEPAPSDAAIETEWHFEDDEEEYDVERILDSRRSGRKIEYLVKWLGYDNEENSWEPTENFSPATNEKLRSFH